MRWVEPWERNSKVSNWILFFVGKTETMTVHKATKKIHDQKRKTLKVFQIIFNPSKLLQGHNNLVIPTKRSPINKSWWVPSGPKELDHLGMKMMLWTAISRQVFVVGFCEACFRHFNFNLKGRLSKLCSLFWISYEDWRQQQAGELSKAAAALLETERTAAAADSKGKEPLGWPKWSPPLRKVERNITDWTRYNRKFKGTCNF